MLLDLDPLLFQLGPFAVRWYGLMVAVSILIGLQLLVIHGRRRGLGEEYMYGAAMAAIVGGVVGARVLYVATNLPIYLKEPLEIFRVWRGGLSWHGALLGGALLATVVVRRHRASFGVLADLAVPGLCIGYILVRIANIFNQEVLGRMSDFGFGRHPAQLYGSAIGLALLLLNIYLARKPRPPGWLFWAFIFYYSLLRGVIEETFRDNPLYAWGYVNEALGVGFFTLTHLITPPLMLLAWLLMRRAAESNTGSATDGASGA